MNKKKYERYKSKMCRPKAIFIFPVVFSLLCCRYFVFYNNVINNNNKNAVVHDLPTMTIYTETSENEQAHACVRQSTRTPQDITSHQLLGTCTFVILCCSLKQHTSYRLDAGMFVWIKTENDCGGMCVRNERINRKSMDIGRYKCFWKYIESDIRKSKSKNYVRRK